MEHNIIDPTPIYWDETAEVLYDAEALTRTDLYTLPTTDEYGMTYEREWDGERCLIVGLGRKSGLPVILSPADAKTYPPAPQHPRYNITAEDIDRRCSEAN